MSSLRRTPAGHRVPVGLAASPLGLCPSGGRLAACHPDGVGELLPHTPWAPGVPAKRAGSFRVRARGWERLGGTGTRKASARGLGTGAPPKRGTWACAYHLAGAGLGLLLIAAAGLCVAGCRARGGGARGGGAGEVVVYTSVDEVYAQEVFARFTEGTGIRVRPVFDTEAGKTTGLYRRLLAERSRPRADVFWNAELCRTIELAEAGVAEELSPLVPADIPRRWVDPGGRWVAFSVRARAIVYNTKMVTEASAPKTLRELTEEPWRGKVAMANPLFGTTASHVAALYEVMGEEEAEKFLRALKVNEVRLVEGNSVVRDLVAHGEVAVGLTDTDDIFSGIDNGYPIALILPDQEGMGAFVIPNSVMLVSGGPDRSAAEAFVRFLLSPEVEELLAFGRARQVPVRADVPRPTELASLAALRAMDVDYGKVAQRMPAVARRVEQLLLR